MPAKIAIVTPSYGRPAYLNQVWSYIRWQRTAAALRWFVLDDSPEPHPEFHGRETPGLTYAWSSKRLVLGAKRNWLNVQALAWGAAYICAMDDDDWYGPSYVEDMQGILQASRFAGSGEDHYYDVLTGRILFAAAVRPNSSCNGVLCYRAEVVAKGSRYSDTANSGEEPAFIGRDLVAQHPDVKRIHLALAHPGNTVSKRNYRIDPRCQTTLTLDDFPMREEHKAFYRALTARAGG
jgi:hypothetical protein